MPKQTYPGTYICTSIHWKHLNTLKSADRKVYTVSSIVVYVDDDAKNKISKIEVQRTVVNVWWRLQCCTHFKL